MWSAHRGEELTPVSALTAMTFIRRFEEECLALSGEGLVQGSIHLCVGQEAIPVGAMSVLGEQDRVISTYRGHGWALACGADPTAVMAEIAQRAGGVNGGRTGSPLLSDPSVGFLGENSIVGAGTPIAAGAAMAAVANDTGGVVVVSIGDGAMNQGSTTEAMVFAAARQLPVIFICENNQWSEMTPIAWTTRGEDLADRGRGLGIDSHVVDGGDPFAVATAVAAAAETCRRGEGPVLLECKTIRLSGHYNRDIEHYRPTTDQEHARQNDPIVRLAQRLEADGAHEQQELDALDANVTADVHAVGQAVRVMPEPAPETALEHLYAPPRTEPVAGFEDAAPAKELTYQRAINAALRQELAARPEVVVYGEDVGFAGGIFGVSRGLQKEFGPQRVFDTPIAEAAILGSAVGAAMEGLRPVVEIMWADFVFVALDQIVNQAANVRYINSSRLTAPLTIRMQQGVTPGACAQHSQSIEAILAHIPGIKVGLPATPQDAYRMTLAAIEDPDPTVLIEFRSLYQTTGEVTLGGPIEPAFGARRYGTGRDLAIITWGSMLHTVLQAADTLRAEGIDASVLDLRWLNPIDDAAISQLVTQTGGRVMIVHEANTTGGFGAEIAARISEQHFADLTAPVTRLGTPDVRMPSAPSLQDALLPNATTIADTARRLIAHAAVVR
jgi:2-oxoisovalerate dehydrogenase E1 component